MLVLNLISNDIEHLLRLTNHCLCHKTEKKPPGKRAENSGM